MALDGLGARAISLTGAQLGITTETVHSSARIVDINTERVRRHLDDGFIVVAAGFRARLLKAIPRRSDAEALTRRRLRLRQRLARRLATSSPT
jgi:hypothetical protein